MEKSKAVKFFADDRFATEAAEITIDMTGENTAACSMPILPRHKNSAGYVMGGAVYTLSDFTAAVASNDGINITVTQSGNIVFLSSASEGTLHSKAVCLKSGKTVSVYEVTVTDDGGKTISTAVFNVFTKR